MSRDEREYTETSLARENAETPRFAGYRSVFRSSVVRRLVLVYFFVQVGFYGLNLWLPHLVKTTIGGSYLVVGAIVAIPYLFAIVGLWINARSADRTGGDGAGGGHRRALGLLQVVSSASGESASSRFSCVICARSLSVQPRRDATRMRLAGVESPALGRLDLSGRGHAGVSARAFH